MKISILDRFAADAINAPAAVTGGSGKCGGGSTKSKKSHSKKSKKSHSKKTKKSKSTKSNHCGCTPPPPPCGSKS